ncbi:hypothetical protein BC739_002690 [Kutzneria viridogrisea]|uniref:Uncharacterized protein n=2 Tax=Kutzneria TaxID=43356 RepID=W5WHH4_9PSEU|nr:hypothetical protein [Kutzneria albida]AHI00313.1 hypothetical protein KALB_6954 [Kutzneria albida DSM 43870]MBA8925491.1 hypothetical protein [Kutzneria viridogrisea]
MQPTLELTELDSLIDQLDTQVSEIAVDARTPDSAICTLVGCSISRWEC